METGTAQKMNEVRFAELAERLYRAIRFLAMRCDGARRLDGQGFNKHDAGYGGFLAGVNPQHWTIKETNGAQNMLRKYRGQLEQGGFDLSSLGIVDAKKAKKEVVKKEVANVVEFRNSSGESFKLIGILGRESNMLEGIISVCSRHGYTVNQNGQEQTRFETIAIGINKNSKAGKGFVDVDVSKFVDERDGRVFVFSVKLYQRDVKAIADIKATFLKRMFDFEKCVWTVSASIPQIIDFVDRQFLMFTDRAAEFVARIQEQKKQEKPKAAYGNEWKANDALSLFD